MLGHRERIFERDLVGGPFVFVPTFLGAPYEALGEFALARRDRHELLDEELEDRVLARRQVGQFLLLVVARGDASDETERKERGCCDSLFHGLSFVRA